MGVASGHGLQKVFVCSWSNHGCSVVRMYSCG